MAHRNSPGYFCTCMHLFFVSAVTCPLLLGAFFADRDGNRYGWGLRSRGRFTLEINCNKFLWTKYRHLFSVFTYRHCFMISRWKCQQLLSSIYSLLDYQLVMPNVWCWNDLHSYSSKHVEAMEACPSWGWHDGGTSAPGCTARWRQSNERERHCHRTCHHKKQTSLSYLWRRMCKARVGRRV